MKEKFDKNLIVAMPEDLFDEFKEVCDKKYTTRSQVVRDFILQYIKENKNGKESNN